MDATRKTIRILGLFLLLAGLSVGFGQADPITLDGIVWTLSYDPVPTEATDTNHDIYRITLTGDTSGSTRPGNYIESVAIKVSDAVYAAQSTLFDAPDGAGDWTYEQGGLSAQGCNGNGSGWACASDDDGGASAPIGGVLSWTFDLEVADGELFTDPLESHFKVRFVNTPGGGKVGSLISEDITLMKPDQPIPEPTTLLLFGSGLLAGVGALRKRIGL